MSLSFGFVFLCVGVALASEETYRAGFGAPTAGNLDYLPLIYEAGKLNVDILVLPSPQVSTLSSLERSCEVDSYDEMVKTLSTASKEAGLYVVAHLLEKTRCQNKNELVRSNLVFDREGNVVSVYRKPLTNIANCTTATDIGTFSTDFGVQFGLLMEEDLVLQKVEDLKELTNFVVAGAWSSEIAILSGPKEEDVNYGLAAFDGVRHFDGTRNIGAQTCAVFACAGLYKRTCTFGSQNNNTNIIFEKISISGNFTENLQYPIILTTDSRIETNKFNIKTKNTYQVTLEALDVENLMTFGLFGRDFSKDSEHFVLNTDPVSIYESINEEMNELFDYLWIRLRILLIIASIYVLEMM